MRCVLTDLGVKISGSCPWKMKKKIPLYPYSVSMGISCISLIPSYGIQKLELKANQLLKVKSPLKTSIFIYCISTCSTFCIVRGTKVYLLAIYVKGNVPIEPGEP